MFKYITLTQCKDKVIGGKNLQDGGYFRGDYPIMERLQYSNDMVPSKTPLKEFINERCCEIAVMSSFTMMTKEQQALVDMLQNKFSPKGIVTSEKLDVTRDNRVFVFNPDIPKTLGISVKDYAKNFGLGIINTLGYVNTTNIKPIVENTIALVMLSATQIGPELVDIIMDGVQLDEAKYLAIQSEDYQKDLIQKNIQTTGGIPTRV
ncbi:MAG: hypothetical protein ACRC92_26180 [Peptostreptococcaceae bacterium]